MVSIILSIYNEQHTIPELVRRIDHVMGKYGHPDWECLAVDDASTDSSWEEIEKASHKYKRLIPIRHFNRQGQKGCFMTGFEKAKGDILLLMDADLQVIPEEIPVVLDKIFIDKSDWVCTYNKISNGGKHRSIISGIGNIFMRLFFRTPVQDAGNNFVAFRKQFVKGVKLVRNDQRYLLPIALSRGLKREKIAEAAVIFDKRRFGRSKYSMLRKSLTGVIEMLALKFRILKGFYAAKTP